MVAEDCEGGEHERNADGARTPEWKEQPEAAYFTQERVKAQSLQVLNKTCM